MNIVTVKYEAQGQPFFWWPRTTMDRDFCLLVCFFLPPMMRSLQERLFYLVLIYCTESGLISDKANVAEEFSF